MPKRELSKEEPKKIDDWDFLTKYQMLSPELKLLHQIVLLRSDTDTIIYILLSFIPLILALKYNLAIAFFSVTILLYGFYRHLRKRADLKHRFEHASTFGVK
ncbi:hypothetical protein J4233_04045 [Candidatus Pacearchaeota archaeon]|nr:hypothetical protein [Candidatus Pacearchaeota archaeon]